MAVLHNRVSQKELKERLYQETEPRVTLSFYKYFIIPEPDHFRDELYVLFSAWKVFGRIYIASEGVNAQISIPTSGFQAFKTFMETSPDFTGTRLNIAVDDDGKSFWVLKIKIRAKIVADGIDDPAFNMKNKGRYVNAEQFNELTEDPRTIVVDMRNHYEYEVGHFDRAIAIPSDTFREQLPMSVELLEKDKERNIIMYCTGGIRCEKASAYLLHRGFVNVFHLEGGIINYANTVKEKGLNNKFRGKNFVFDDRLGERITADVIAQCHQCGKPADTHTNCRNEACHLLFIQCDECRERYAGCCSAACQHQYRLPETERKLLRKGKHKEITEFNKSRLRKKLS